MECSTCQSPLQLKGIQSFTDDSDSPNWKLLGDHLGDHSGAEIYLCGSCGKIELYAVHPDETLINIEDPDIAPNADHAELQWRTPIKIEPIANIKVIPLRDEGDTTPTDINEILKVTPGVSNLEEVFEKIGYPFAEHHLPTGTLLCFHSDDPHNPHSILLDSNYWLVKMVAIHNDVGAFDLENLGDAYGQQEFVTRMDGSEYWMYEAHGVAKVTEGFNDEAILFVQFFENRLDMNRYMELNCFSQETFMCDGPDTGWPE